MILLDEAYCDEEVGPGQTEIAQRVPVWEVAEIGCEEADKALQRALRDGPRLRRRRAVAGDDPGEDLLPRSCLLSGIRLGLPLALPPLDGAIGSGLAEGEGIGDDVGDRVGETEA